MPSKVNVQITGRIGNLVFYKLKDQYCVRSVPAHVKQTKATKARAMEFGRAARGGKALRQQMVAVIPFPPDNKMQTRLVTAIFKWLKLHPDNTIEPSDDLPFINNFQFTEGYTLAERWKVSLKVNKPSQGLIELKIPAFVPERSFSAPAHTVSVTCKIAAAGFRVGDGVATGSFLASLQYDYNNIEVPSQTVSLPLPTPGGSVIVTGISLEFNLLKNGQPVKTSNKKFMPAGLVSAMYV